MHNLIKRLWRCLLPAPPIESFGPRMIYVEPAEIGPVVKGDEGAVWRVIGVVWPDRTR